MAIVRWQPRNLVRINPAQEMETIHSELDRIWDWAFGNENGGMSRPLVPAMDVLEEDNRYVIRAELPGVTKDDLEITYQDGLLTLKGERKQKESSKQGRFFVRERFEGKFGRNIQLPEKVDPDKIEARFEDGVLELTLPFTPEAQPRKIEIRK